MNMLENVYKHVILQMISQTNDCARSLVQAMCNEGKGGAELDIQG